VKLDRLALREERRNETRETTRHRQHQHETQRKEHVKKKKKKKKKKKREAEELRMELDLLYSERYAAREEKGNKKTTCHQRQHQCHASHPAHKRGTYQKSLRSCQRSPFWKGQGMT
jgi:hypothetical protein